MRKLWALATSLPSLAYAGVVLASSLWVWHGRSVSGAYERGRKAVLDSAQFDSALVALADSARAKAEQSTDSVITVVRWRVASVDSQAIVAAALARQLPPEIDTMPSVVALKAAVFDLAHSTRALRDSIPARVQAAVDAERAAGALQRDVLTAQITEARLVNIAQADTITALKKRPTWKAVGGAVVGGIVTGVGLVLVLAR